MNVLDLFSGIGGFSLGLERAGMRTVAFCEIDPYCRAVLKKHWPAAPIFEDVKLLTGKTGRSLFYRGEKQAAACFSRDIDVICGGFPCQDISLAGKGAGMAGERSGLWSEYARLIRELRPRYAIVENVAALLGRGLSDVLGDLAALGYDAEWHCIPASAVGAPHRRDRIWIVAYPQIESGRARFCKTKSVSNGHQPSDCSGDVADTERPRLEGRIRSALMELQGTTGEIRSIGAGDIPGRQSRQWLVEPDVGRVANGIPSRVDRLRALGNAVVPQIPEIIGRAIMRASA